MAKNNNSCQSLIPSFLYSSSAGSSYNGGVPHLLQQSKLSPSSNSGDRGVLSKNFAIPAPSEKIEMFSPAYYLACTAGGIFSCGLTHMTVTPLDLVKCNMQV
jgi:solute carrier family 25 phosphate transporter 3